ncbi:hypothetical protein EUTSA_v10014229mg [Eutrema salsugineum]|uniref:TF-B3 domain-containing protein n=1 Tax=Eutrema salsugineum TaxID=72664 RepID=V4LFY9_EUTSA|nr:B3 domain-containing protein At5g57720 [Eutrema salsugineum]ESQ42629.1 hypothetical protein EUTSA_v10014229mg [Eutrema salsugineum]
MVFSPYPDFGFTFNSQDLSLSQRLVIPSDYRMYYPNPLPQTAVLRKPEGNFWNVKWTISQEGTISFEDGWSKFVTDNGPIHGDILLFSYDGCRNFFVRIYRNGLVVETKSPIKIQEISDDDDERNSSDDDDDDHDMENEEDSNDENKIISLSLGSSDEDDDDDDDDDTTLAEVNKSNGSSKKGGTSQKKRAESIGDPAMYLDDPTNPCFIPISSYRRMMVIAQQVIKDHDLKFGETINLIDGFGQVEGKVVEWKDRIVVYSWDEVCKRNHAKLEDVIICEILHERGLVQSIKAHFVKK